MQSGREEERCAIKFYFTLEKNATETYVMLQTAFEASCMNRASVLEWKPASLSGMMRGVGGVNTPELIGQRVRDRVSVRVTMLRFEKSSG